MTLKEAKAAGYRASDCTYTRQYVSRKIDIMQQEVHTAGGTRKGQLYVLLPNWRSTTYSFRQYLVKEV